MRPIKFRAWDKKNREWLEWFAVQNDGSVIIPDNRYEQEIQGWSEAPDHIIVVRFTGLKDKNGTEIYEGDILLAKDMPDSPSVVEGDKVRGRKKRSRWLIHWDEQIASFRLAEKLGGELTYNVAEVTDIWQPTWEVIGNIYENPELIK